MRLKIFYHIDHFVMLSLRFPYFSRVNRYGTWIRKNTGDSCYCTGEKTDDNNDDVDISAGSEASSTAAMDTDKQKGHQLKY